MNIGRRTFLLASAGAVLVACGKEKSEDPRELTAEEAELLATARFQLFRRGTVPVRMELPGDPSTTITADLVLDQGFAYGTTATEAGDRVIAWSRAKLATAAFDGDAVPEADSPAWAARAVTTANRQDLFLTLALNMGSDRPENPLLLRRSTARYLRSDKVDGVGVKIFGGARPAGDTSSPRTRFWIDGDGNLRRFEADLGDSRGRLATITVIDEAAVPPGLAEVADTVLSSGAGG